MPSHSHSTILFDRAGRYVRPAAKPGAALPEPPEHQQIEGDQRCQPFSPSA